MRPLPLALTGVFLPFLVAGCVTEEVAGGDPPRLLDLPETYLAGVYHEVSMFFEVKPEDVPDAASWMAREGEHQLPPIVPEIAPGGVEVYRVRDLHRVVYRNSMFEVGKHRYLRMPQARLYIFKERPGNFSFAYRGQGIIVRSPGPWKPSVYYYPQMEFHQGTARFTKEVVQVGSSTIENLPDRGLWLVNGKPYHPDATRPLEIQGALRPPAGP
jgi:hypothetical protein